MLKAIVLVFVMCAVTTSALIGAIEVSRSLTGQTYYSWILFPFVLYMFLAILPKIKPGR